MGKMLSLSLALGTAVIASASVAHAEATKRPPTNELVGFIGLGGPGPGGIPPPQVSISAGKAGVISIVTGYLGGSSESLAYLEFIPTRFRGLSAPVCLIQPNAFPDSGSGTPRTPGAFILSSPMSVQYFQDSVRDWHVGVSFDLTPIQPSTAYELDFVCFKTPGERSDD